jgi:hypothetical protein
MKRLYIVFHADDYFARDALIGEIKHHGFGVEFTDSLENSDGVIAIIGANTGTAAEIQPGIDCARQCNKPILTLVSHPENALKPEFQAFSPVKWEWPALEAFLSKF